MHLCEEIIPGLSEDEIVKYSGSTIYDRGLDYYEHGAVTEVVKSDNSLRALVEGSYNYKVKITVNRDGVKKSSCNCPYDGYYCKHIVAVLLHCLNSPEKVEDLDGLTNSLKNADKEQLIEIIEALIKTDVRLVKKVKLKAARKHVSKESKNNLIDPAPYIEEAEEILSNIPSIGGYEDHEFAEECMYDLMEIIDKAEEFLDNGEGNNALVILKALTETYFDSCPDVEYIDGGIDDFFFHLDNAWSEAVLTAKLSKNERSDLLEQLSHYQKETSNYDISFYKTIAALKEGWDNETLKLILSGKANTECKINDMLVRTRLKILDAQNRFEEYLNLAKHAELQREYVCMLIQQGRAEEATNFAKSELCNVSNVFEIAKKLLDHGHVENAAEVATKGLELEGNKSELVAWLSDLAKSIGSKDLAKTALIFSFKESIRSYKYEKIIKLTPPEELDKTKKELLNHVREENSSFHLEDKVEIFLMEHLFDDAIAIADKPGFCCTDFILRKVMEAVVSHKPDWVINHGEKRAMPIIDGGQSKYYNDAVTWLKLACEAYKAAGKDEEWNSLLKNIRDKHGTKSKLMRLMQKEKFYGNM